MRGSDVAAFSRPGGSLHGDWRPMSRTRDAAITQDAAKLCKTLVKLGTLLKLNSYFLMGQVKQGQLRGVYFQGSIKEFKILPQNS